MHIEPDIDSLILQALYPPVETIEGALAQVAGIFEVFIEDIRLNPVRVVMVHAHQVITKLGHSTWPERRRFDAEC